MEGRGKRGGRRKEAGDAAMDGDGGRMEDGGGGFGSGGASRAGGSGRRWEGQERTGLGWGGEDGGDEGGKAGRDTIGTQAQRHGNKVSAASCDVCSCACMVLADVRLASLSGMMAVLRTGGCLLAAEGKAGILLKVREGGIQFSRDRPRSNRGMIATTLLDFNLSVRPEQL